MDLGIQWTEGERGRFLALLMGSALCCPWVRFKFALA